MISSHSEPKTEPTESLFQLIYDAACANDLEKLKNLINQGICFSKITNQKRQPVIEALGEDGQHEAVLFLIKHFFASKEDALKGAKQGQLIWQEKYSSSLAKLTNPKEKNRDKAEIMDLKAKVIELGLKKDQCISLIADLQPALGTQQKQNYGLTYFITEADYIKKFINLKRVIYDLSAGLNKTFSSQVQHEMIQHLLNNNDSLLTSAINGAVAANNANLFYELCQRPLNDAQISAIAHAFVKAKWLPDQEEPLLHFISFIQNESLRNRLIEQAHKNNPAINQMTLCLKAKKIFPLMKEENLTYAQARKWKLNLHYWFLQGTQFVTERGVPLDLFIQMSTYVVEMSFENTKKLFIQHREKMSPKLKIAADEASQKKFADSNDPWNPRFYAVKIMQVDPEKLRKEEKQATEARYNQRMHFVQSIR